MVAAFSVLLVLVAPLAARCCVSSAADAADLCLPKKDETACIAGTIGSRANPIEGVDVILTKPDGSTETQTTEEDGKFAFEVTETGDYLVGVDPDTLPKGSELSHPPSRALRGPEGALKVDDVQLGRSYAATLTSGPRASTTRRASGTSSSSRSVNGLRLGLLLALASVGLCLIYGTTGISNFAHAEQVTLGGMLGYGFINVLGLAAVHRRRPGRDHVRASPAGSRTGSCGSRCDRRGLGLTQLMIVTIGLSLAMQYSFQYFVGAATKQVVVCQPTVRTFGPITITDRSLAAMGISIVVHRAGRLRAAAHPRRAGPPARSPTTRRSRRRRASTPTR